jgi:hypothetical protein
MTKPSLVRRQVIWPSPLPQQAAEELLRRFAADSLYVTFEARAEKGAVSHFVLATPATIRVVCGTIEALTGAVTIKVDAPDDLPTTARLTRSRARFPLGDRPAEASRQLLSALSAARFKKESALVRVSILGSIRPQLLATRNPDPTQSMPSMILAGVRPASGEVNAKLRRTVEEPALRILVTAGAIAKSEARRRTLMSGLLAALRTLEAPEAYLDFTRSEDTLERPRLLGRLTFRPREVLGTMAWPLDAEALPGMPAAHPRQLTMKASKYDKTRVFGHTTAPGPELPIGVSAKSGFSHMHLLGPTDSGKSTAALHLIAASIERGNSILVIDPKSDLANDTLAMVPRERWDDVILIDPANDGPVVGFSPFDSPGTSPEIIADTILRILHDLFPDAFGPRTSQATLSGLLTLAGQPGATLTMLPRLFDDPRLRARLLANNPSIDLQSFWNFYDSLSEGAKAQMIGPVRSRLGQFLLRPQLRRALDQSDQKFHLNDLFTKRGQIVVVSINAGLMGQEASKLAGSLIVSQLQQLTLARLRVPQSQRHPVTIVIDEAQAYVHGSGDQLADLLSRSRGAGVGWVVSHQYRSQMPRDVMSAIDANTANKVFWRLQSDDARAAAAMAPQLSPEDFMTLPKYGIYAYLTHDEPIGWVSGRTLEPPKPLSDPKLVRLHSIARWGKDPVLEAPSQPLIDPPIGRRPRRSS